MTCNCQLHDDNRPTHAGPGRQRMQELVDIFRHWVAQQTPDRQALSCRHGCYVGHHGALMSMPGVCCLCAEHGYSAFDPADASETERAEALL